MMNYKPLIITVAALPLLSGCFPLIIGGAAIGGLAVTQDRELDQSLSDASIRAKLKVAHADFGAKAVAGVNVVVYNGYVYMFGSVNTTDVKNGLVEKAYEVEGVKGVTAELDVDSSYMKEAYAYDAGLATKVRSRLLASFKVNPNDISVIVHRGTVYLVGVLESRTAKEQAIYLARTTKGVSQVVDYFQFDHTSAPVQPN